MALESSVTQDDGISHKAKGRSSVRLRLEARERYLSPFAAQSSQSAGRAIPEPPSDVRTEYQRDRDRILHCKAFRRLKHKTQVFIAPLGDHYVTRLTHTLEVSQIARTIARALNLNEDLAEAIGLGHDLGHTPFGHIGEDELDKLLPGGFRHNQQSLNIVERVERDGHGLNLTHEVRQGILRHSKPRGDFIAALDEDLTLEAQVVRISDAVAYLNHDLADAFRAGIISPADLPASVAATLGKRHSQRIDTVVCDIIDHSWDATGMSCDSTIDDDGAYDSGTNADAIDRNAAIASVNGSLPKHAESITSPNPNRPAITMGEEVRGAFMELREFMFNTVYLPTDDTPEGYAARRIVRFLHGYFSELNHKIPPEYAQRSRSPEEAVVDYVSGMTDNYAIRLAEKLSPGIAKTFSERLL
ncbi:MAG: deoxyguanosinetriphosphate triphosphohydrolase [Chloroflexi bacterium]|nr:deoxyguanosinetriphosphate triphosphohydrolase [Chloroflexota bacterium]